ncbi:DNA processing protein [Evansella vedderi]|uniref:DNA processing protein n=1 Tax=Evansella vedderi TaxID=38282 RepID=A0ABU0A682_9BACI|nr:DNA-processing protein DprA [Evansella vedderi]MDQ0257845.1 DNA processing protein [Evansella vedderi]
MSKLFWVTLSLVKGLGNSGIVKLYRHNPSADFSHLSNPNFITVVNKNVQELLTDQSYMQKTKEKALCHIEAHEQKDITVIPINSDYYPPLLQLINDAPAVIYAKGNFELLKGNKMLAIVGTRKPTRIGIASAKKIASTFAQRDYTIVSGLALGIDTAAHQGALQVKEGKTLAVLAGDLTKIYPIENKGLSKEILKKNGLLISETPIETQNNKGNFVKRDRIQSALALGVCPVQTPLKGGTQHTIKFAKKFQRFLFTPIPLEQEESAVQGNLELISNGTPVLDSVECYDTFDEEMKKTYQTLIERISVNTPTNQANSMKMANYKQSSLF